MFDFLFRAKNSSHGGTHRAKRLQVALEVLENRLVPTASFAPNELLVQFRDVTSQARASARASVNARLKESIHTPQMQGDGQGVLERISLPAGLTVQAAMQRFSRLSSVIYAEPNWLVTSTAVSNDPYYTTSSRLWGMYSNDSPAVVGPSGTTNIYGSQAEKAWDAGFTGSRSVSVGIVDEGIDYTHQDLYQNVWINQREIPASLRSSLFDTDNDGQISFRDLNDTANAAWVTNSNSNGYIDAADILADTRWNNGLDDDGNGYVDDLFGWDFVHGDKTVFDAADGDAHGTHVAGTIGGDGGNGIGVAGVNWQANIIGTKFLGPTGGYTSDAVKALDYLTDLKVREGVNVVASNNSWGGGSYSAALHSAILRAAKANILFVAAAGNSTSNNDTTASYPSNYSTLQGTSTESAAGYESVIAVAAINSSGSLSSFSSYGSTTVDLGAPGEGIYSTVPGGYASYSGTSMATPHVTGAVALYAAAYPGLTAGDIRSALLSSTTPTGSLSGKTTTGGRLDIASLMAKSPVAGISVGDVSITEGNTGTSNAVFMVRLSSPATDTVTVNYATADGTAAAQLDYTAVSGTLSFAVGENSKTILVPVVGDGNVEANETFTVNLSAATGATIVKGQAIGTILNDDSNTISVQDISQNEGNTGNTTFAVTVQLSAPSTQSVGVRYATANGTARTKSDYTATSGTLLFAPGETTKIVNILVKGDTTLEPNETLLVRLSSPTNATLGQSQATVTILNDDGTSTPASDTPYSPENYALSISNISMSEGNRGTTFFVFTVQLSQASTRHVSVNYTTVDGTATSQSDFIRKTGRLTFAPGETTKTFTVQVRGDTVIEADKTFLVRLSGATNGVIGTAEATGTILNDDFAGIR